VCVGVGQPERRRAVRHQHAGAHTHRALQHVRPRLVQRRRGRRWRRVLVRRFGRGRQTGHQRRVSVNLLRVLLLKVKELFKHSIR